jgi:cardiolipin-specific phospholipase
MSQIAAFPEVYELEKKVLAHSGLELDKELFVYDVEITVNGKTYAIHTYRCGDGDENKDTLLLLHGYCGSNLLYFKMLKELSQRFRVFCMDHVGMGLSSRDGFHCTSTEETIELFVESVEEWRKAIGVETFYLAGHSFGGYVGTHYTKKYEFRVKKLVLLSAAGITRYEKEPTVEEASKKYSIFTRWIYTFAMKNWQNKKSPNSLARDHPWIAKFILKQYINNKFALSYDESRAMENYMHAMMKLPAGTEDGIFYILKPPGAIAFNPLEDILCEININIDCYFGETDHLDQSGAKRISEKKSDFKMKVVPKAAHQCIVQNPVDLAKELVMSIPV